uniref:Uncharacterized protein n=1 Tax=Panagrolaimus davidi TaxID=227884 RepID=A0A914Q0Y7_9BILA
MASSNSARAIYLNRKRKAEYSKMVISKPACFYAKYFEQNFAMPDSIIFYIAKNPKTPELYFKMVKTCEYFFIKNPILVIPNLNADDGKWRSGNVPLNLTKYDCKFWITDKIYASADEFIDKNIFSPIIPKFYRCDVKHLFLFSQVVSFNALSLLISSAEEIYLRNVIVKKCDSVIPLEDIVAIAVNAKKFAITKPTITSKTMKELTKLSHFSEFDYFTLYDFSEVFDIDEFYDYLKKNQHTKISIGINPQISDAFKNRLETIIDEILETKQFNYKPPFINIPGLDIQKYRKLCQIYDFY